MFQEQVANHSGLMVEGMLSLLTICPHEVAHLPEMNHGPRFWATVGRLWPDYEAMFGRIGRERGWPAPTFDHFLQEVQHGSVCAGSPETVASKIAYAVTALDAQRFDLKYSNGPLPHTNLMRSIELYATEVAPRVRRLLA